MGEGSRAQRGLARLCLLISGRACRRRVWRWHGIDAMPGGLRAMRGRARGAGCGQASGLLIAMQGNSMPDGRRFRVGTSLLYPSVR